MRQKLRTWVNCLNVNLWWLILSNTLPYDMHPPLCWWDIRLRSWVLKYFNQTCSFWWICNTVLIWRFSHRFTASPSEENTLPLWDWSLSAWSPSTPKEVSNLMMKIFNKHSICSSKSLWARRESASSSFHHMEGEFWYAKS